MTRIDFTSEPPEYWEFLGEEDLSVAATVYGELVGADVREEDIVFPRDVQCPRFFVDSMGARYVEHVRLADQGIRRPERFTAGQYNPNNRWNTESGIVHLVQRNNTLFAETTLAANATRRFAVRPDLETQVDRFTLTAAGGFGGVNRNSDPSIGSFVNDLALDGHRVMVSNPLGLFISEAVATVSWARRLQIGVPESSLDPDSTRAIMRAMSGGRGE